MFLIWSLFILLTGTSITDPLDAAGNTAMYNGEEGTWVMQAMASNGLIFVVLAVTLVIWSVLLFYLLRLEKKLSALEKEILNKKND